MSKLEPLLRVEDVAQILSVRQSTVYEWARIEYIPSIQLGTGAKKACVRFDRAELEKWLDARKKSGRHVRVPTKSELN
jgi:excisionase family DNA binding protein